MPEVASLYASLGVQMAEFNAGMAKAERDFLALGAKLNAMPDLHIDVDTSGLQQEMAGAERTVATGAARMSEALPPISPEIDTSGMRANLSSAQNAVAAATASIDASFEKITDVEEFHELGEAIQGVAREVEDMGRSVTRVGNRMSLGVTLPVLAAGGAAVKVAADFEALEIGLEAVTGSAAIAADQIERLRDIAKEPAVDLEQAARTALSFQAIGKDAEFAERMIRGIANAVALSGEGAESFAGVARQMRQVASLGRLMGEEMNVILENAPAMAAAIEFAFGTTSTETIREMGLTSDQFFERLLAGMESLPKVTGGAKNSFENFGQAVRQAAEAIGDQLLPVIVPITEGTSEWLEDLRELNPEIIRWGIAIAAAAALMGPLLIIVGQMTTAVGLLSIAIGVGMIPLLATGGALFIGLAALSALFVKNKLDAAAARAEAEKYVDSLTQGLASMTKAEAEHHAEMLRMQKERAEVGLRNLEALRDASVRISPTGTRVSGEDTEQLTEQVREQQFVVDRLADAYERAAKRAEELAAAPPAKPLPPLPESNTASDKYVATLAEAVRLGLATNEQERELRRLTFENFRAADDANVPLERRVELIGLANDGLRAGLEAQRKHALMTAEETARLRLQGGGEVRAEGLPTEETERAALGIERISREMLAVQDAANGIAFSFANAFGAIISQTTTAADAFKNLARSIIRDLTAMIARLALFHGLMALFGGANLSKVFGSTLLGFDIGGGVSKVTSGSNAAARTSGMANAVSQTGQAGGLTLVLSVPQSDDPIELANNARWQRAFRETALVAQSQGFNLAIATR